MALMTERGSLWCPIRKKYVADRPEERIRLRVIKDLQERGYPLSAMQVEYRVGEAGRFDLAVFTRSGDIWMLVECKQSFPGKSYADIAQLAQAQLRRYAQALEKRWKVYYLGIAIGERFYCLNHTSKKWEPEIPPYPA
jgi:Holliday junction resolvase-like predicted endonuclease